MNREIKFRGIRTDNGEWSYGHFLISQKADKTWYIVADVLNSELMAVVPESLGQYTGLKDRNGNDIYEGDIMYCFGMLPYKVIYEDGLFLLRNSQVSDINLPLWSECEVIGNIFQNPELLSND